MQRVISYICYSCHIAFLLYSGTMSAIFKHLQVLYPHMLFLYIMRHSVNINRV